MMLFFALPFVLFLSVVNFICLYPVCFLSVSAFVLNKADTVLIHFRYKRVGSLLPVNPEASLPGSGRCPGAAINRDARMQEIFEFESGAVFPI